jgi:hypothetical protein
MASRIVGDVFPAQRWSRLAGDSEELRDHLLTAAALDGGVPGECAEQRGAQATVDHAETTDSDFVSIVEPRRGQLCGDRRGQITQSFHPTSLGHRPLGTRHYVPARACPCKLLDYVI